MARPDPQPESQPSKQSSPDPDWPAVEIALERYFLAREDGEPIDVVTACDGNAALVEQVLKVLGASPDLVVETAAQPEVSTLDSFGDFDVVQQIGKGGMGTVYLAMQRSLGRQVALKVLDGAAKTMPSARTRMRREAELTALLEHPNIIPVYAVGEVGGAPFIAMKYIAGPSLAEIEQPLTPEAIAELGVALAEGLDAAHLQGIVHRDVKPANILMDGNVPMLVDFGLARGQTDATLTQEGKVAGTLRYMAPERLDATTEVLDPRIDIYGLGATLYELLTVRELFADQNPTTLVRSVLARDPAPMRLRGRHHDLETIVMRALAKEPRRRFATAREMAEDLRRYLRGEPVTSRRLTAVQRGFRTAQRFPRTAALIATALLLLSLTIGIVTSNANAATADLRRRLAYAEQLGQEGRHLRAQEELTLIAQTFTDDQAVSRALATASAQVAIEDLLVAIANRSFVVDPSVIERLNTQLSKGAPRNSQLALTRAIARHQTSGSSDADRALTQVSDRVLQSRAGTAVASLLANTALPWPLPEYEARPLPDDVLITCMALRVAGATGPRVLEELSLAPSTGSSRLLFIEAVVHWDLGQNAIAEGILKGLAERGGVPVHWRWLAKLQASLGKFANAKASLQRAGAARARSADRIHFQIELGLAAAAADQDAIEALIAELRSLPDPHVEVVRLLAEYDGKSSTDLTADAVERVLALAAVDRLAPADRDIYLATAMEIDAWHLPHNAAENELAALRKMHRQFLSRWRQRADEIQHGPAQRRAEHWLACSMTIGGDAQDRAEALAMLKALCQTEAVSSETIAFYALAAFQIEADENALVARMYRGDALRAIDSALAKIERGYLSMPTANADALRESGALLCQTLGDTLGSAQRRLTFPTHADDADLEQRERFSNWVRATLEQFALSR